MRNPWKKFKYLLLFMNLSFAAMQGMFLTLNIMSDSFTHWLFFLQIGFITFFIYTRVSGFRQHCRLDRAWEVIDQDLERMLAELTIQFEQRMMTVENVNWKRDGF